VEFRDIKFRNGDHKYIYENESIYDCGEHSAREITAEPDITTTTVYPKVSGLATWNENCKWYSSLPLDAIV
jgi:hypothetical protein